VLIAVGVRPVPYTSNVHGCKPSRNFRIRLNIYRIVKYVLALTYTTIKSKCLSLYKLKIWLTQSYSWKPKGLPSLRLASKSPQTWFTVLKNLRSLSNIKKLTSYFTEEASDVAKGPPKPWNRDKTFEDFKYLKTSSCYVTCN
jgi:hypothetical protein